eukprot:322714-Rhodomonas_salina.1
MAAPPHAVKQQQLKPFTTYCQLGSLTCSLLPTRESDLELDRLDCLYEGGLAWASRHRHALAHRGNHRPLRLAAPLVLRDTPESQR